MRQFITDKTTLPGQPQYYFNVTHPYDVANAGTSPLHATHLLEEVLRTYIPTRWLCCAISQSARELTEKTGDPMYLLIAGCLRCLVELKVYELEGVRRGERIGYSTFEHPENRTEALRQICSAYAVPFVPGGV